jgi:hypothetical protein
MPVEDIDVAGASEDDHDRFAMISLFDLNAEKTKERGNDEFKKGSSKGYEIAKRFYSLSLSFDPMQHAVYSNRSFANLKLGLPHFAAADAERCVAICPHFVKGHIRLADAYLAMGSIKEAVSCLRDAIQGPCSGNEEDVQFLKKKMQESMSPDSANRVMVMKHAMGFDDPSLIHEPIFGVRTGRTVPSIQLPFQKNGLRAQLKRMSCLSLAMLYGMLHITLGAALPRPSCNTNSSHLTDSESNTVFTCLDDAPALLPCSSLATARP